MTKDKETENNRFSLINSNHNKNDAPQSCPKISENQTNPIYRILFKLTHSELTKKKENYKSFTKFKPKDWL